MSSCTRFGTGRRSRASCASAASSRPADMTCSRVRLSPDGANHPAIALVLLAAIIGWFTWFVVSGDSHGFDLRERAEVHEESSPALTRAMRAVTWAGAPSLIWPLAIAGAVLLARAYRRFIVI